MRSAILILALLATVLASSPATAETATVRLGQVEVKPYVLLQFDGGGTSGADRPGGQSAGFNMRRARLGAEADVAQQWQFGFIWDFGGTPGNHSSLYEAKAAYIGLQPFNFAAGVFKPSFTLELAQSSAALLFLERASIVNVVGGLVGGGGRVVLGQAGASGERWFATALVTGGKTGPGAESDQRGLLGRAAGLAVKGDAVALHLGVSGAWVFQPPRGAGGRPTVALSDQPELRIDNTSALLSTGALDTPSAELGGVEAGLGWGRLWVQAEWYGIGVDRSAATGPGVFFSGWYAQAAYTLLGTPRQWNSGTASWGSPTPSDEFNPRHGSWGALEVGARFSTVDLSSDDVRGGRQRVWTTGISWYPIKPLRLVLQYQHADLEGVSTPRSLDALAGRVQVSF